MTYFEELAQDLGVEITTDENGLYTKRAAALAKITNDVLLSDETFYLGWNEKRKLIADRFLNVFPYMRREATA